MKRIISAILLAALLIGGAFGSMGLFETSNSPELSRVLDGADLLTDGEERSLEKKISRLGEEWGFDVLIITVNSDVGDVEPYAEDIYDTHGYGYGVGADGILLIVSMYERDWLISATGYGIEAFTDYGRDIIGEKVAEHLSAEDYSGAFNKFVKLTDKFLKKAAKGQPYDYDEELITAGDFFVRIFMGIVIGCIVGGIVVGVQSAGMKTAVAQRSAEGYMEQGSLVMGTGKDMFITSVITKTPKAQAQPKSGGGGGRSGGSTTHRASSGRSHASSRGKF